MKRIAILFSGGFESNIILNQIIVGKNINKIDLIHISFGYSWEKSEIEHIKKVIIPYYNRYYNNCKIELISINLTLNGKNYMNINKKIKNIKDNVLLLRNLTLIVNGGLYCLNNNINELYIGIQGLNTDIYKDTSLEYLKNIENLIKIDNPEFKLKLPLYTRKKEDLIKYIKEKNIPKKLFFSCHNPINNKMCGECYKCKTLNNVLNKI